MLEARITYSDGRRHVIEANTLDILREKCETYIKNDEVVDIWVVKFEGLGWLKSMFAPTLKV